MASKSQTVFRYDKNNLLTEFEALFVNNASFSALSSGLNRFNPIEVMRMARQEIRHSAILAWLLDPRETHGFGDQFLKGFLAEALRGDENRRAPSAIEVSLSDLRDTSIRREKRNIDLFVDSPSNGWAFVIENKFGSKQSNSQLERYRKIAEADAESAGRKLIVRGIFLTLNEEEPEDSSYVVLRYADVAGILSDLLKINREWLGGEVRQFLQHYLEVVEKETGMSNEHDHLVDLAKQLYREHRKVLDFIWAHGATTGFSLASDAVFGEGMNYGDEAKVGERTYVFNSSNDRQFSFLPTSWTSGLGGEKEKQELWGGCEGWWARYPLICYFGMVAESDFKGTLRLTAEVGPVANSALRRLIVDQIEYVANEKQLNHIVQFRSDAKRELARYSRFFKHRAIHIEDISDPDAIAKAMRDLLTQFAPVFDAIDGILPLVLKEARQKS